MPSLSPFDAKRLLSQVPGWEIKENPARIEKTYRFKAFKQAMVFVNQVADKAESEGHHPDFYIHYNQVRLELWTHAVGGLSENDFILAAKIDEGEQR